MSPINHHQQQVAVMPSANSFLQPPNQDTFRRAQSDSMLHTSVAKNNNQQSMMIGVGQTGQMMSGQNYLLPNQPYHSQLANQTMVFQQQHQQIYQQQQQYQQPQQPQQYMYSQQQQQQQANYGLTYPSQQQNVQQPDLTKNLPLSSSPSLSSTPTSTNAPVFSTSGASSPTNGIPPNQHHLNNNNHMSNYSEKFKNVINNINFYLNQIQNTKIKAIDSFNPIYHLI